VIHECSKKVSRGDGHGRRVALRRICPFRPKAESQSDRDSPLSRRAGRDRRSVDPRRVPYRHDLRLVPYPNTWRCGRRSFSFRPGVSALCQRRSAARQRPRVPGRLNLDDAAPDARPVPVRPGDGLGWQLPWMLRVLSRHSIVARLLCLCPAQSKIGRRSMRCMFMRGGSAVGQTTRPGSCAASRRSGSWSAQTLRDGGSRASRSRTGRR